MPSLLHPALPPTRTCLLLRSHAAWATATALLLCSCGEREPSITERYQSALTQWESGKPESRNEARVTIASLAGFDEGHPQHGGAHRWMGLDLYAQINPRRQQEARQTLNLAGRHLRRAIELGTEDEETILTLAQILQRTGGADEAIALLAERLDRMPGLGIQLAWLYDERGDPAKSAPAAILGAAHWRGVVEREPTNLDARLRWARGAMLSGHEEEALEIIGAGRSVGTDRRYDAFEAALRLRQADRAPAGGGEEADRVIGYLEKAQRLMPGNPAIVNRLAALSEQDEATRNRVREAFGRMISAGLAGAPVHAALGELEMKAGDLPTALKHLETARAMAPRNPFTSCQIAWCLVHLNPPDPEKAMEVWEQTLALVPGFNRNPVGQRTLGAILVKLGRIEEGIAELEKAQSLLDGEMREELEAILTEARAAGGGAGARDDNGGSAKEEISGEEEKSVSPE